jgi:hypothetical protein
MWSLWLGFTAPHFPYEPNPERIEALYAGQSDEQLLPPDELYDLAADSAEEKNLIADPAAQEVLRDLRSRLLVWLQRNGDPALAWARFESKP